LGKKLEDPRRGGGKTPGGNLVIGIDGGKNHRLKENLKGEEKGGFGKPVHDGGEEQKGRCVTLRAPKTEIIPGVLECGSKKKGGVKVENLRGPHASKKKKKKGRGGRKYRDLKQGGRFL